MTPAHISPEFYFLPYYTILRAIPSKIGGVIAMVGAILIMLLLPILDSSRIRGFRFRPIGSMVYWLFLANFFILLWIGAQPVEVPYDEIGMYATIGYFFYFVQLPILGYGEDILVHVGRGGGLGVGRGIGATPQSQTVQRDSQVSSGGGIGGGIGGGNTFN